MSSYADGKYASSYKDRLVSDALPKAIKSLEKSYKYILEKQSRKCLMNSNSATNSDKGLFYREDCKCIGCHFSEKYSKVYKAEYLIFLLPLATVLSDEHSKLLCDFNIKVKSTTVAKALQDQIDFYTKISKDMGFTNIFNSEAEDVAHLEL